ncbi:MAG: DUF86 domain-containing protein, partial [Spirochaetota bacterium]|nr:DUF86 domain-containing protein [Spirochaetota bacterium]
NLINSSIDIAKIILASEKQTLPQTYRQIMEDLSLIKDFNPHTSKTLSKYAKLRNILAHDYIDTRFIQIRMFIDEAESAYKDLLSFVKNLIKI